MDTKELKKKVEEVTTIAAGVILADLILPFLKDASKKAEAYIKKSEGGKK